MKPTIGPAVSSTEGRKLLVESILLLMGIDPKEVKEGEVYTLDFNLDKYKQMFVERYL